MSELQSLSKIFTEKIFRIPDYQRGYAWSNELLSGQLSGQIADFWEDLINLAPGKKHYTGVLTLEEASEEKFGNWIEDLWLIRSKGYKPYFIVDGQQRLTTAIIFIQAMLEVIGEKAILNYTSSAEIRKKFIYEEKIGSFLRTYVFGYEKDNPSNEFLKTRIFNDNTIASTGTETVYTFNLEKAKMFFVDNLRKLPPDEVESVYVKLTQNLLFNEYIIDNDIDVFVAFETMNNRGKKLSNLELLKNRLIYLSTLFSESQSEEKIKLRAEINACWKQIYEYLGKNRANPLDDDEFLRTHWITYFTYSRRKGDDYARFLFNKKFTPKAALENMHTDLNNTDEINLSITEEDIDEYEDVSMQEGGKDLVSAVNLFEIRNYVQSLQVAVKHWYNICNPIGNSDLSPEEQSYLDKLNRVGFNYFGPLILAAYSAEEDKQKIISLLHEIERCIFLVFRVAQVRANAGNSKFYKLAREVYYKKKSLDEAVIEIKEFINENFDVDLFSKFIKKKFETGSKLGYYGWYGLKYFLYEYELYLMRQSHVSNQKIYWEKFINKEDFVTIEHMFPEDPSKSCWQERFGQFSEEQQHKLMHSLGNLLALSRPKNSSLLNECFEKKKSRNEAVGYFNGSYSENKVALKPDWTANEILERGLEMLDFFEENWQITLHSREDKCRLLQLDFLIR